MGFVLSFIKIRDQPLGRQVCLTMPHEPRLVFSYLGDVLGYLTCIELWDIARNTLIIVLEHPSQCLCTWLA